ncbi:MAG: phage tail sheath family protein [Verrucomicrobiales bacterium]|nr:phage tail sheath family protein [Verrucomicrobiales bacterium]
MPNTIKTPGVFITEKNAFPNSVVQVATAIPAFIGYTPQAHPVYRGRSCARTPIRIESFGDFLAHFAVQTTPSHGGPPEIAPDDQQYAPRYHAIPAKQGSGGDITLSGQHYDLEPDPGSVYYLFSSLKLFFQNGGGPCYVISIGSYGPISGKPKAKDEALINPNVLYADLKAGLDLLLTEQEPTMIVIPDAALLSRGEHASLMQDVLRQCGAMRSRIGIVDVPGGDAPDPASWMSDDILPFRIAIGTEFLSYGAAYYPFLRTSIVSEADIGMANLGGPSVLAGLLPEAAAEPVKTLLATAANPPAANALTPVQLESALRGASKSYSALVQGVLGKINTLPPSAAMAGIYAATDDSRGVWAAPARVGINALGVTLAISDAAQSDLNIDAASGKSINAIRYFPGKGVMPWGARTLDGNSNEWRYISVRRTLIMIEQSLQLATQAYVFEPNTENTWVTIASMASNFLDNLWKQGAFVGAKPEEAFSVAIGLGRTMTAQDILDGSLRLMVLVAVLRPAEFLAVQIHQKMQPS